MPFWRREKPEAREFLTKYRSRFRDLKLDDLNKVESELIRFSDHLCSVRNVKSIDVVDRITMAYGLRWSKFNYLSCLWAWSITLSPFVRVRVPRDLLVEEITRYMQWYERLGEDKGLVSDLEDVARTIECRVVTASMEPVERRRLRFLPKGDWIFLLVEIDPDSVNQFIDVEDVDRVLKILEHSIVIVKSDFVSAVEKASAEVSRTLESR
ncbi:MAG: hypothetical protein ACE5OY_00815 [Candidatus Bathyarchaeia archaeon]